MATRYAIKHRTTGIFLALRPSLGAGHRETAHESDACSFATMSEATMELLELGAFASAWDTVPVEVEMRADTPSVELLEKRAREQGNR